MDSQKSLKPSDSEIERLKITHQIDVEDKKIADEHEEREFEHKVYWTSCCVRMDKRAVIFFSQFIFSIIIVAFCVIMLGLEQDCATFSRYSPLLTLVIGIWLPQPQFKSD